jgi:hypothetical protein
MTDKPIETELFRLTIEAVGKTRAAALSHAYIVYHGVLMAAGNEDQTTSGVRGSASARWEKVKTTAEDTL